VRAQAVQARDGNAQEWRVCAATEGRPRQVCSRHCRFLWSAYAYTAKCCLFRGMALSVTMLDAMMEVAR